MPVISKPSKATHELPNARFTSLATPSRGSNETSVWRVEIKAGVPATPHEVTREEVFLILSGRARVRLGDVVARAGEGDVIVVPANTAFEIASDGDEPIEALCCLPVGGQARLADGQLFTPPWAE